jgi:long-chain acyl-CoA synthetase
MNLARLITRPARRDPSLTAITTGATRWSYGELADRVAHTAASLIARHGLRPGDRVALAMENCPEFLQILFACWHAGLCAVPMNAKLHPKELAYILEDSGAAMCVASPVLCPGIAAAAKGDGGVRLVATGERDFAALLDAAAGDPADVAPDAAAWLFYTSGTTGRPKGAVLTARNLLFMTNCYYADIERVAPGDTMIHAAPLSHGSGLYALPHLAQGGHQLIPESSHFDAAEILGLIARHPRVSLFAAPTMVVRLVNGPVAGDFDARNLATIVYGGAPMYVADLERALKLFGPKLVQIYGQGESPMTITALSKADHADKDRLASCGTARTGVEVRVVDDEDRDLPAGAIGEIVTRSDCVMAGYWGNPAASATTLRGGWLHTGDVGALDEGGFLTLKDRSKDLIISGGSNIYPREIEEVLLLDPRVVEASVIGVAHAEWGEEVVACVVTRPGGDIAAAELDRLCLDHIARFKRPRRYVFVDALPKNNYGKVLKTELRRRLAQERA